jgi:hypothetical protein
MPSEDTETFACSMHQNLRPKFVYEPCTDKKGKKLFPIYKEIQKGSVAKSYMTYGLLIYG